MSNSVPATSLFDAVEAGDVEAFRAMCTDDFVIWHNTDMAERSLDELMGHLTRLCAVADLAYTERRYLAVDDGAWVQHVVTGKTSGGQPFALPIALRIITDEEGKIRRIEEYADSASGAILLDDLALGDPAEQDWTRKPSLA